MAGSGLSRRPNIRSRDELYSCLTLPGVVHKNNERKALLTKREEVSHERVVSGVGLAEIVYRARRQWIGLCTD